MKIVVRDQNPNFIDAFKAVLSDHNFDHITAECGHVFDKTADALVSPANSFGFMDGGIDQIYLNRWPDIQNKVQQAIKIKTFHELFVGQALRVNTDDVFFPFLIVAPTMRVPMPIRDPVDVFLATRAATYCAMNIEFVDIHTIVFPGMGTGCGGVDYTKAARSMLRGFLLDQEFPKSTSHALTKHYSYPY